MMDNDITVSDLKIMKGARNYRRWLFEQAQPHLGKTVLEVGAGIGNYTEFMIDRERVACVEIHHDATVHLRERFADLPHVTIYKGDIADPDFDSLIVDQYDSVLCFNVLEHIEDEMAALANMKNSLVEGGNLLLIVPAVPQVMGTVDESLGHYRRYTRKTLVDVIGRAGFLAQKTYYLNSLGLIGWFWNNKITRRTEESKSQIHFYSRFVVPLLSVVEAVITPPVGLSLVCLARSR